MSYYARIHKCAHFTYLVITANQNNTKVLLSLYISESVKDLVSPLIDVNSEDGLPRRQLHVILFLLSCSLYSIIIEFDESHVQCYDW